MGLYNFKSQFVRPILLGEKTHTVRGVRRYPDEPGRTMHLYMGLRTRSTMLLMRAPCVAVQEIKIHPWLGVWIDGEHVAGDERDAFARRDGFPGGFEQMIDFWEGRLPFHGHILHWNFDARRDAMEPTSERLRDKGSEQE